MKKSIFIAAVLFISAFASTVSAAPYTNTELLDKGIQCLEDASDIKPTLGGMYTIIKTFNSCQDYNFAAVENSESKASERLISLKNLYYDVLKTLRKQEYIVQQLYKYKIIASTQYKSMINTLASNRCKNLPVFMESDIKQIFSVRGAFTNQQKKEIQYFKKAACDNSHILRITPVNPTIKNLTFVKGLLDKTGGNLYSISPTGIYQYSMGTSFSAIIQKKIDELSKK